MVGRCLWLSKIDNKPIGLSYRGADIRQERVGDDDASRILQSNAKRIPKGRVFGAHAHHPIRRETIGTHEAWVVVSGSVRVTLFDLDDTTLASIELGPGDCVVTFRGGHALTADANTLLYEFKNGPYLGQEADKRWLG